MGSYISLYIIFDIDTRLSMISVSLFDLYSPHADAKHFHHSWIYQYNAATYASFPRLLESWARYIIDISK